MKAESIEQIREHLSRGGRVLSVNKAGHERAVTRVDRKIVFVESEAWCTFDNTEIDHWELVPIDEPSGNHAGDCTIYASKSNGQPTDGICTCGHELKQLRRKVLDELADEAQELGLDEDQVPNRMERIRTALLYGRKPEMQDLLDWWQATTGERIEWGRRCNECECSGRINRRTVHEIDCPECNGSGYTVRPTWMEVGSGDE